MGRRQRTRERRANMELQVVRVPVRDTGLGREAGCANDAELVAAEDQRAKVDALLTPEARAKIEAAEREFERRILGF